jgi:kynurenine formamidase
MNGNSEATWQAEAAVVSNWGRWGAEDQLGTLNLIGDDEVRRGAACVRTGQVLPLGVALDGLLPHGHSGFRRNPIHVMLVDGGDENLAANSQGFRDPGLDSAKMVMTDDFRFTEDMIILPMQAGTQWDGLPHVYYNEKMYNGFSSSSVTSFGASRCGIEQAAHHGVVGRGVLLDVARALKTDSLPDKFVISPQLLDETANAQRVSIESGDIVLIRTGWWGKFAKDRDNRSFLLDYAGLGWPCAKWAYEQEIACVAMDNSGVEVLGDGTHPFHKLALRDMGMMLGEIWNLEALADACSQDGFYDFLLVAQPLDVPGGVASSINPVAIR